MLNTNAYKVKTYQPNSDYSTEEGHKHCQNVDPMKGQAYIFSFLLSIPRCKQIVHVCDPFTVRLGSDGVVKIPATARWAPLRQSIRRPPVHPGAASRAPVFLRYGDAAATAAAGRKLCITATLKTVTAINIHINCRSERAPNSFEGGTDFLSGH